MVAFGLLACGRTFEFRRLWKDCPWMPEALAQHCHSELDVAVVAVVAPRLPRTVDSTPAAGRVGRETTAVAVAVVAPCTAAIAPAGVESCLQVCPHGPGREWSPAVAAAVVHTVAFAVGRRTFACAVVVGPVSSRPFEA